MMLVKYVRAPGRHVYAPKIKGPCKYKVGLTIKAAILHKKYFILILILFF